MATPTPPKPWESASLVAQAKDTPLASRDDLKPWDVPGAGDYVAGTQACRSIRSLLFLFTFSQRDFVFVCCSVCSIIETMARWVHKSTPQSLILISFSLLISDRF